MLISLSTYIKNHKVTINVLNSNAMWQGLFLFSSFTYLHFLSLRNYLLQFLKFIYWFDNLLASKQFTLSTVILRTCLSPLGSDTPHLATLYMETLLTVQSLTPYTDPMHHPTRPPLQWMRASLCLGSDSVPATWAPSLLCFPTLRHPSMRVSSSCPDPLCQMVSYCYGGSVKCPHPRHWSPSW